MKLKLKEVYLDELSKVDEPEGGPFGKVLFAPQRTDDVEPEENTSEETELHGSLKRWYKGNTRALQNDYRKILALIKQEKYENLLAPPPGYVYRFLFDLSLREVAGFLGKTPNEVREETGRFLYSVSKKGILKTHRGPLQSWTANPKLGPLVELFAGEVLKRDSGALLIKANTQSEGNKFFMSPNFAEKIKGLFMYAPEYEVISAGPVKIEGTAYFVNPRSMQDKTPLSASDVMGVERVLKGLFNVFGL